jgi:hypothetical protein
VYVFRITRQNGAYRDVSVDDEDTHHVIAGPKWYLLNSGGGRLYVARTVHEAGKKRTVLLHRLITEAAADLDVDHKDGDTANNTRDNLRVTSTARNCQNQRKKKNNTSGFKGVYWDARRSHWVASICRDYKSTYLGSFSTREAAYQAYLTASAIVHGEFSNPG